jgi:hypothetical protein
MTDNITVTNTIQNVTVTNTQPNVTVSNVGAQGPAGPTQPIFYTFTKATASNIWTITHNLNGYPTAVVFDSANNQCEGTISYTNANIMVITFTASFSGIAYVV